MEGEILDLWSGSEKTILFVTHDLEEAIALSDEVVVLSAGPASRSLGQYPVICSGPVSLWRSKLIATLATCTGRSGQTCGEKFCAVMSNHSSNRGVPIIVWQALLGATLLYAWQAGVDAGIVDKFFLSRPTDIAGRVWQWVSTGSVWEHLGVTLLEAVLSFSIGVALGVGLGFLLARFKWIGMLLDPYIRVANALPRVVLAPLFLLWFGPRHLEQGSAGGNGGVFHRLFQHLLGSAGS
jgi:hypothetical protein